MIEDPNTPSPKFWGYHLMLDVAGIPLSYVSDPLRIKNWAKDLVQVIDMAPYGEPQVIHFGHGELAGWTVSQLITTSNIMAHFNDADGSAYVDIFSCKPFDPALATSHFAKTFLTDKIRVNYITRQAPV